MKAVLLVLMLAMLTCGVASADASWEVVAPARYSTDAITQLAELNGVIYGGTTINSSLYRYNEPAQQWDMVAGQYGSEDGIFALIVYNGKIYGGTQPGAKLLEWNGVDAWTLAANGIGAEQYILSLCVHNNSLFAGTATHGQLWEWNDVDAFTHVGTCGSEIFLRSLGVWNNNLYGGTYDHAQLYMWNGVDAMTLAASQYGAETQIVSPLVVFNGNIHAVTYTHANLVHFDGSAWIQNAPQAGGTEQYMRGFTIYNNALYGGSYPNGKLWRYDNISAWVEVVGTFAGTELMSLIVGSDGKLYAGTNTGVLLRLIYPPSIASYAPTGTISPNVHDSQLFNITTDQDTECHWYVNGSQMQHNSSFSTTHAYTNTSLNGGGCNVTAVVNNTNGTDSQTWIFWVGVGWEVVAPARYSTDQITQLVELNNVIYGSTTLNSSLYRYNEPMQQWDMVAGHYGSEDRADALIVYNGKIYGGTYPGAKLLEWNGVDAWTLAANGLGAEQFILSLCVHNNSLFAGTAYHGQLWKWNDVDAFTHVGTCGSEQYMRNLIVWNNNLYGGTYDHAQLYMWNGVDAMTLAAPQYGSETQIKSPLVAFNDVIHAVTYTHANLVHFDGSAWIQDAPQAGGTESEMRGFTIYNNSLYGGSYPSGKLWRYDDINAWVEVVGTFAGDQLMSLIVGSDGKLYAGTSTGVLLRLNAEAEDPGMIELAGIYDNILCTVYPNGSVWSEQSISGHSLQNLSIVPTSMLTINVTTLTEPVKRYNESASSDAYALYTVGESNADTTYVVNIFADANGTNMQTFYVASNDTGYITYNATGYGYDRWVEITRADTSYATHLTALTPGTAANSITTTDTCANASFGAATLTGGSDSDSEWAGSDVPTGVDIWRDGAGMIAIAVLALLAGIVIVFLRGGGIGEGLTISPNAAIGLAVGLLVLLAIFGIAPIFGDKIDSVADLGQETYATGRLTFVLDGTTADGETVTIDATTLEFDRSADGVTAGRVAVNISDGTAATASLNLTAAINGNATLAAVVVARRDVST